MAKVAEYDGIASIKPDGENATVTLEFVQGQFRTTISTTVAGSELLKMLQGKKIETKICEDAVQQRAKRPKELVDG